MKTVMKMMVIRIMVMKKMLKRQKKKRWEKENQKVIVKVAMKKMVATMAVKTSRLVVSVNVA